MRESFEVNGNGDVAKMEVLLDVQPFDAEYANQVSFSAPEDGTKKVFATIPLADFQELGSPDKVTVSVSPA